MKYLSSLSSIWCFSRFLLSLEITIFLNTKEFRKQKKMTSYFSKKNLPRYRSSDCCFAKENKLLSTKITTGIGALMNLGWKESNCEYS